MLYYIRNPFGMLGWTTPYLDLVPPVRQGTLDSSLTPAWSVRCHDLRLVPRHMNPSQALLERPPPWLLRTTSPAYSSSWCPSYCSFRMSMVRKMENVACLLQEFKYIKHPQSELQIYSSVYTVLSVNHIKVNHWLGDSQSMTIITNQ